MDPVDYMTAQRQQPDANTSRQINSLRALMQFYDQQHPLSGGGQSGQDWQNNARMMFAQNAMNEQGSQQQPQDFFGGQNAPQYAPPQMPQQIAQQAGFPLAPQDRPPQMGPRPQVSALGMGQNFLRNLFPR